MILHRVWEYSVMPSWSVYMHRIRFQLKFCTITFCRPSDVKDRFLVCLKLNPSWPVTTNGQFVKDEAWWSSYLVSQVWKANFVLMWTFLWKSPQGQALSPSLLCWRFTESFWSVRSETRSVWLITWWRTTTFPLKMQRSLSSFLLKQIRYNFIFLLPVKLLVTFSLSPDFKGLSDNFTTSVSPANLFPAWLALLVMPVGSCKNLAGW